MASSLRSVCKDITELTTCEWDLRSRCAVRGIPAGTAACSWNNGRRASQEGLLGKCMVSIGIVIFLLQCALALEDDSVYETSGSSPSPEDPVSLPPPSHLLGGWTRSHNDPLYNVHSYGPVPSSNTRQQPAFGSILTMLASTAWRPQNLVQPRASEGNFSSGVNQTGQWLTDDLVKRAKPSFMSSSSSSTASSSAILGPIGNYSDGSEEPAPDDLFTSRGGDAFSKGNDSSSFQKKAKDSLSSASSMQTASISQTLIQVTTPTTVAPATTTTATTTTTTTMATTTVPTTTRATTTELTTTSTTTSSPPRTLPPARPPSRTITIHTPRTGFPRMTTTMLTTTTTAGPPPPRCNITTRMWVRSVLSIHLRRSRLDNVLRQNLPRGLSQALRKALNDSALHVQIETLSTVPNVTVGYLVLRGDMVYTPAAVVDALGGYGLERLMMDVRQFVPLVQAIPIPAMPWMPSPTISLLLRTVLRFVNEADEVPSCRFSQMMEQRLERGFAEAEAKVFGTQSSLSVQILSASQVFGSPSVSLVYVVWNGSMALNGTMASSLLNQLTSELVGYYLFYPPLISAEPLEYHNLNTSTATKDYWVITVIQDVDNSSLEAQYQSFASVMEQRLAELFVVAHQQGARFRRAASAGSYTVQMVSMRRVSGPRNPAELTYYVQMNGAPLAGSSAAKVLNTVDSQTMALTLGYFVQLQAEPVVKNPPSNLWIIAAVMAPIGVVTVIIIIITAVLCRKNKSDFKTDSIGNLNPRAKSAYRRDAGYYIQPVQGFDYAKQHLGQQGGDEETLPVTQDTKVLPLPIRDAPLSLEKVMHPDGSSSKKTLSIEIRKRLPSEDGSVISNESAKRHSGRGSTVPKVATQQKMTKEEPRKRNDPYDTSSGSLQLISIKPMAAPPTYSHPASSDRSQDSAIFNGEVSLALKQKSDIEHYRNKLRLKAKRKGYYDLPLAEGGGRGSSSSSKAVGQRHQHGHQRVPHGQSRALESEEDHSSTYVKSHRRDLQGKHPAYRSRQSLNSPSPGGTEMDLLVMRERPRKGIRNSGYDTEPEIIEETNVDRLVSQRSYGYGRQVKGHSETSTLSSQPSIDEVRQQMHLLLEEAFSLASAGHSSSSRRHHHHLHPQHASSHHHQMGPYNPGPPIPYSEVVTSAPGTMSRNQRALQWVPAYGSDLYQCSLPKPAFRFTQLPDMAMGSPPPPIPPRTGPPGNSLRRSSSDLGPKALSMESSVTDVQSQHDSAPYIPVSRAALPSITTDQPLPINHSGNPISAVYAIPAARSDYPGYFLSTPPSSYHSPSWMSYPPEPEDVPPQWAESVPLPGYAEAFPLPRYPQGSPLFLSYRQPPPPPLLGGAERPISPSTAISQQSLVDPLDLSGPNNSLPSLSTTALVKAIREEVAKLAKKQSDMFEFQV